MPRRLVASAPAPVKKPVADKKETDDGEKKASKKKDKKEK